MDGKHDMIRILMAWSLVCLATTMFVAEVQAQSNPTRGAVSGAIIGGAVGGRRGAAVGATAGAIAGANSRHRHWHNYYWRLEYD